MLPSSTVAVPIVETAPLPTGAQFLNVIESVFSGMARAIVHNSDYKTLDDAKAAFDRYFQERNAHFRQHPRRAGNKIWRKEREPAAFSEANNCKDPVLPLRGRPAWRAPAASDGGAGFGREGTAKGPSGSAPRYCRTGALTWTRPRRPRPPASGAAPSGASPASGSCPHGS